MNIRELDFWLGPTEPLIKPEYFGQIVATAADIAIVVSLEGTIETIVVNPLNQTMGKLDHWINRDLEDFLAEDSKSRVRSVLDNYASGMAEITPAVEVNHFDNAMWDFPIRYSFHLTGRDGNVLMLGRDLRPIAELQQRLVKAQLALEKDYEGQRAFETRYRVLMETSRDPLVLVDASTCRVIDANEAGGALLGANPETMAGSIFGHMFVGRKANDLVEDLIRVATENGSSGLEVKTSGQQKIGIRPTLFRAAGDRLLLCRLDKERKVEAAGHEVAGGLAALYQRAADAIVFTDEHGVIQSANDAFLSLCNAALSADVNGRSLAELLVRGKVDMKVLLENASHSGRMRVFSSQLIGKHGARTPVEISATHLADQPHNKFAFVLRDSSRNEVLREDAANSNGENMHNIVELVGSSPLKEIVSATTDVIEKMCIQTAVELTGNNRVAVAEMLGLSRQSLYVKLRKYGLLEKSSDD